MSNINDAPTLSPAQALDYLAKLFTPDSGKSDAFGRERISNPVTLFDSKQVADNQPLFWSDMQFSGTGTSSVYQTGTASTLIGVTDNTAGIRVRQTKRRFNYQPGKGILVSVTGVLNPDNVSTGTLRQIGYNDNANGLFFQLSGTTLAVGIKNNGVDTIYNQSNWNIDKLDGTGASKINIDPTKSQIFVIDFQWLGVGKIRWGFEINGELFYCHSQSFSNVGTSVYMGNPNLPVRYLIQNYGNGPTATLKAICASVVSEGGAEKTGFELSIDRGSTSLTTLNNNGLYPLLAMRLNQNNLGAFIRLSKVSIICDSTSNFRWAILLNPIVSGTAFNYSSVNNSAIQSDTSTTNNTTVYGGTQIASGYQSQTVTNLAGINSDLPEVLTLGTDVLNNSDILVLVVQRLSSQAETFYGSISYRETV